MRDKLNRFVDNTIGNFQEVSYKEAIFQCMDLVYEWIFCLDIPKATIQHLYAFEVFTKPNDLTREYFEIIPNTDSFIPQDGDIAVYKGGEAGHIAIALGGGSTAKFLQYEQNKPLGTNPHIGESNYANCLGFLRPKVKNPDTLKWLRQMYQERGVDLTLPEGDVRFRVQEIFDSAKKTEELKEQVNRLNQRVEEAEGEVTRLNTASANDIKKIKQLSEEVDELKKQVVNRDTQISQLQARLTAIESQINPDKVVVLTKEEFARLTATKTLDKFTGLELLKEILKRLVVKK